LDEKKQSLPERIGMMKQHKFLHRSRFLCGVAASLALAAGALGQAVPGRMGATASTLPPQLQNVGFEPPLSGQLPLSLHFRDETGADVTLGNYFGHKPVVLSFVYYSCPMLCNQVQQGVVGSLKMLSFNPVRDYEVVFVSFDPSDTPVRAANKKEAALSHFSRAETAAGWHFLTGSPESIQSLTHAANFRYSFDRGKNLFAHASGVMLMTPDGRISRYFYGVEYPSRDMRLGLVDASAGKIGNPIDHLLLYCFAYDPSTGRYSATILRIIRLGGLLTIFAIVAGIVIFRRRDLARISVASRPSHSDDSVQGAH
jgi:protein SCO1